MYWGIGMKRRGVVLTTGYVTNQSTEGQTIGKMLEQGKDRAREGWE